MSSEHVYNYIVIYGNLFLIAPFPDLCLLVPSYILSKNPNAPSNILLNISKTKKL